MAFLLAKYNQLADYFYSNSDSRLDGYPLMDSWVYSGIICSTYVAMSRIGPILMRNRPAFEIRRLLVAYNIFMVFFSSWIVYEFLQAGWWNQYAFIGCEPVDYTRSATGLRMIRVAWFSYVIRLIEMLDTVFFILRKKSELITFLHVFHHVSMPFSLYFGMKVAAGGFGSFYTMVNSFVHIFLYAYYAIAAAGPQYQRYLWWKQHLTVVQMIQFLVIMVHSSQGIFNRVCNYPKWIAYSIFIYGLIFFLLFANYFYQTYTRVKTRPHRQKDEKVKHLPTNGVLSSSSSNGGVSTGIYHANGEATRKREKHECNGRPNAE